MESSTASTEASTTSIEASTTPTIAPTRFYITDGSFRGIGGRLEASIYFRENKQIVEDPCPVTTSGVL